MSESHFDPLKSIQMEKIKNHNNTIETKYLDHELNKFKKEISMARTRLLVVHDNHENNSLTYKPLDNTKLISSFSHGHECVEDFYKDSENASLMEKRIFENFTDRSDEVDANMLEKESVQCIDKFIETNKIDTAKIDERYVRFGDLIEVINYDEEELTNSEKCSDRQLDSNDDIEIEPVLEVKLIPKEQVTIEPILELVGKPMHHSVDQATIKRDDKPIRIQMIGGLQIPCDEMSTNKKEPFIITKLNVINQSNQSKDIVDHPIVDSELQIPPEQSAIVSDLFTKDIQSDTMRQNTLQKYFLRWIHFTSIEKISKENVSCNQSRIQKIEAFLNNIRMEKKKHMRNDSRIVDVKKKNAEPENPAALARKYHNK